MDFKNSKDIQVTFLGDFSIKIEGKLLLNQKERSKRVLMLIEYLLTNRQRTIPINKLATTFWEESEYNPPNALKNLVYRARELLKELSGNQHVEYIQFTQGTYRWNEGLGCSVDTEQFISLWKLGSDISKSKMERLESLENALKLYRGNFLATSPSASWILELSEYYSTICIDCALEACNLLIEMNCYSKVISICETVLQHMPLKEEVHKLLLKAYITTGQLNKAFDHYNRFVNLIRGELGADAANSIHLFYNGLLNNTDISEPDLSVIKNDFMESEKIAGAFYCDYDIFKAIYHIVARSIKRTGKTIFLILFTLSDLNNKIPSVELLEHSMEQLLSVIMSSLRKGDVVTAYSATQLVVMLSLDSYENAEKVVNRVLQEFKSGYQRDGVKIDTKINAIDSVN